MTVRKFCNEIYKRAGWILVLCRVEFFKISKRDVTFIREMRVQVCVQKNKDNFLENMLDHCAKFCRRVTDVSMSSSSWQRNFNKTLNSCIIPEEKVKTPSLRCKYMYNVHKTFIYCKSKLKILFFFLLKKKSIFSHVCSQDLSQTFTIGGVCSKIMRHFLLNKR